MNISRSVLALAALAALAACSDDPAPVTPDAPPDAMTDEVPPAPQLGMQIDRMGRAAISTILIGLRDPAATADMKKDAYNAAADPGMWGATPIAGGRTIIAEFAANLGLLDVLDKGNPAIPSTPMSPTGCKNQVLYNGNPGGGGSPNQSSYNTLARLLADDMLYVDTSKTTCNRYLELELDVWTGGVYRHSECGGRTPTHDVIDVSYSMLIAGIAGLTSQPNLLPRLKDGVSAHTDVSDTAFPYFGRPR